MENFRKSSLVRKVLDNLFLVAAYYGFARLGQLWAISPGNITPIWPPSGIILAAVLLRGYYVWPGIFLGAFLGNAWAYFDLHSMHSLAASLAAGMANGAGDALGAVAGAFLITQITGTRDPFHKATHIVAFIASGVLLGSLISAVFGVTALCAGGFLNWAAYWQSFFHWVIGDGMGVLLLTPLLVAWRTPSSEQRLSIERLVYWGVLLGTTSLYTLDTPMSSVAFHLPEFTVVPLLMWAIFRFSRRTAFTAMCVVAVMVLWPGILERGLFSGHVLSQSLLEAQTFLAANVIAMLLLHGVLTERRRSQNALEAINAGLDQQIRERTAQLKASNVELEQLRKAIESIQLGITITSLDRQILYANPAEAEMHGYQVDELLGNDVRIFAPAEFNTRIAVEQVERWNGLVRESMNVRKDGTCFPVHLTSEIVKDVDGSPCAIVTSCEDITRQKQIEEELFHYRANLEKLVEARTAELEREKAALRSNELKYRTLFERSNNAIVLHNTAGRIIDVNPQYCAMLGYAKDDLLHRNLFSTVIAEEQEKNLKAMTRFQANGSIRLETRLQKADGDVISVEISASFIDRKQGIVQGIIRDITERKRAEDALHAAKEAAEQANQAKSDFLANMTHELRTPLNGILGYTQILRRDPALSDQHQEQIDIIHRSGEHLLILLNDILDLAKIEAGKLDVNPVVFTLSELLKSIYELIAIRAHEKGVTFLQEVDSTIPQAFRGDKIRLRQILFNLLGNAIKFTEQGWVRLRVSSLCFGDELQKVRQTHSFHELDGFGEIDRAVRQPPQTSPQISATHLLRFEVEDTGPGIAPESIAKIFNPFVQVGEGHRHIAGTGLGLAISQRLAAMMNTRIQAQSSPGKGSLFWFDITLPEAELPETYAALATGKIVGIQHAEQAKRKVLLVDDEPTSLTLVQTMLEPLGFEIVSAMNGLDAYQLAENFQPDIVLLDLRLPDVNGFEIARNIRRIPGLQQVAIIIVSASVQGITQKEAIKAECQDFLPKPVQFSALLETLQRHLNLAWDYEETREHKLNEAHKEPPDAKLLLPPIEELQCLRDFVETGMILDIQQWIDRLADEDQRYAPFLSKIRDMSKAFQFDQLRAWISTCLEEHYDGRT